jgi:hypothetical protein
MSDIGIVRLDLDRMAQQLSALPVHPAHPIVGGKVCQLVGPPLSCMQQTEVQMRLRAIGIHQLGCNQSSNAAPKARCCSEVIVRGSFPASARAASTRTARTGSVSSRPIT